MRAFYLIAALLIVSTTASLKYGTLLDENEATWTLWFTDTMGDETLGGPAAVACFRQENWLGSLPNAGAEGFYFNVWTDSTGAPLSQSKFEWVTSDSSQGTFIKDARYPSPVTLDYSQWSTVNTNGAGLGFTGRSIVVSNNNPGISLWENDQFDDTDPLDMAEMRCWTQQFTDGALQAEYDLTTFSSPKKYSATPNDMPFPNEDSYISKVPYDFCFLDAGINLYFGLASIFALVMSFFF